MAYRFRRSDASTQDGVRRIAVEQIDRAMREIDDETLDPHETVHQVRKRCKKLRGLIRLVRPVFDDYTEENRAIRDAARELSFLRDTEALIETYDSLTRHYGGQIDRSAFAPIRRKLTLRQKKAAEAADPEATIAAFRVRMVALRQRAAKWRLNADEFDAAIGKGLAKTYKRGRRAMARAKEDGSDEAVHEWRKRVKYHWYHTRLLTGTWSGPMEAHADGASKLGDLLGDHHDLSVFREALLDESAGFGRPEELEVLLGLLDERQSVLAAKAFALGGKLLAEPAGALAHRWGTYWDVWLKEGQPPRADRAA